MLIPRKYINIFSTNSMFIMMNYRCFFYRSEVTFYVNAPPKFYIRFIFLQIFTETRGLPLDTLVHACDTPTHFQAVELSLTWLGSHATT